MIQVQFHIHIQSNYIWASHIFWSQITTCFENLFQVPPFQHMDDIVLENFCGPVKSLIFTKGELVSSCYYPKPWLHFECLNLLYHKRFSIHLAPLDVKILYTNHHYEIWADRWLGLKKVSNYKIKTRVCNLFGQSKT